MGSRIGRPREVCPSPGGHDIDNVTDQMQGLYEPDEDEQTPDVIECWRCQELNEPNPSYCMRCGAPLAEETTAKIEE